MTEIEMTPEGAIRTLKADYEGGYSPCDATAAELRRHNCAYSLRAVMTSREYALARAKVAREDGWVDHYPTDYADAMRHAEYYG